MKIIQHRDEVAQVEPSLRAFIHKVSPWLQDDLSMDAVGFIYILNHEDIGQSDVPLHPLEESGALELSGDSVWEYVEHDPVINYWNCVVILGDGYGLSLFLSDEYVASIPTLAQSLRTLAEKGIYHVE